MARLRNNPGPEGWNGHSVRVRRVSRGLRGRDMVELILNRCELEVSLPSYLAYEQGTRRPPARVARAVAYVFGISLEEMNKPIDL